MNGQGRSHLSTYLQETFWGIKVKKLHISLAESGKVATFAAYKNKKRMQNDYHPEQISSQSECSNAKVGGLLEDASDVARRVLESVQALAGTTYCKRVQIAKLKQWAQQNGHWIDDISSLGTFSDRGSENEVYLAKNEDKIVYKLNDFRYSDDNLCPFFERIEAHNCYFPQCAYSLIGFADNQDGKTCAVLAQPFIISNREATELEIVNEMERMGFHSKDEGSYFTNGTHDIFDALPNNVLVGIDGYLYFIDTIIFLSNTGGYEKYHSLSPRFSS